MATTTTGAIVERFDASAAAALASGSGGQLWVGEVPEQYSVASGPFAALQPGRAEAEFNFRTRYMEREEVTFVCLADRLAAAETLARTVEQVFDPKNLSLDCQTATLMAANRNHYRIAGVEPWRDPNNELVYRVEVEYSFLWQRSY